MKKKYGIKLSAAVGLFLAALFVCLHALTLPQPVFAETAGGLRIVLDAGHGGIDGGVTGVKTGVKESTLNLQIAFVCKTALEELGFSVTMTRKTEAGLYGTPTKGFKRRDMQARRGIIQAAKPDFVISIHQNRYPSSSTRGAQVFYSNASRDGNRFATALQNRLNELYAKEGVKARAATAGSFFILECAPVPSVIVECGFLSNAADETLLRNPSWQNALAQSMIRGLTDYFSQVSS